MFRFNGVIEKIRRNTITKVIDQSQVAVQVSVFLLLDGVTACAMSRK